MKTIAKVYDAYSGTTTDVNYSSHSDLMEQIWDYLWETYDANVLGDDIKVTLPYENIEFQWLGVYAHYCFAKGRISEEEAFDIMCAESNKIRENKKTCQVA